MKAFEQIKKLRENASQIRNLFNVNFPEWKSNEKRYDKIGIGFNINDRFKSCAKMEIWFSSWMGTYGDSSCGSQLRLDDDVFKQHFLKYLNKNQKEIMLLISNSIEKEAVLLKEKALEEVNAQIEELMELDNLEEDII